MEQGDHVLPVRHSAVAAGHRHAAEANSRNLQAAGAESAFLHQWFSFGWLDLPPTLFAWRPVGEPDSPPRLLARSGKVPFERTWPFASRGCSRWAACQTAN